MRATSLYYKYIFASCFLLLFSVNVLAVNVSSNASRRFQLSNSTIHVGGSEEVAPLKMLFKIDKKTGRTCMLLIVKKNDEAISTEWREVK